MARCRRKAEVERWFDGEPTDEEALMSHVASCGECARELAALETLRARVSETVTRREISDAQFPAFMENIRERTGSAPRRWPGVWAFASLSAAALLVALSAFVMFAGGPDQARAVTEIESYSTGIENATVESYSSDNGTATVWVTVPTGADIW